MSGGNESLTILLAVKQESAIEPVLQQAKVMGLGCDTIKPVLLSKIESIRSLKRFAHMSGKLLITLTVSLVLAGCDHCTKGGRWHDGYVQADPRCTYFCSDPEEKYCAKSPAAAEQLQVKDLPNIQKRAAQQLDADIGESKKVCTKLGFKLDTDAMANCLLSQQQMMTFQRTEANQRNQQAARAAEADAMQRANAFSNGFRNGVLDYKAMGTNKMTCVPSGTGTALNCE